MVQLQVNIKLTNEHGLQVQLDVLTREDATKEEVFVANTMQNTFIAVMQDVATQDGLNVTVTPIPPNGRNVRLEPS